MWKTNQKLVALSKIHAPGARYTLRGFNLLLNPANHLDPATDTANHGNLAAITIALHRENEKISTIIESLPPADSKRAFYQDVLSSNSTHLQHFFPKLQKQLAIEETLPIDLLSGFIYYGQRNGLVTREYFDTHLKARVEAKLEYVSLQNASELILGLTQLGYDAQTPLIQRLGAIAAQKLQARGKPTTVSYATYSNHMYTESKPCSNKGSHSCLANGTIQSTAAKIVGAELLQKYM